MIMGINWSTPKEDMKLIGQIADRALEMGLNDGKVEVMMDVTAVHLNDVELDLNKLLHFDDFNFGHDINGIRGHVDTHTGKLLRGFLPRCTK